MGPTNGANRAETMAEGRVETSGKDIPGARLLWTVALREVETQTTPEAYAKWLAELRFVAEVDDAILVCARDQLTLDRITADYARALQTSWKALDSRGRRLKFQVWSQVDAAVKDMVEDPWLVPSATEVEDTTSTGTTDMCFETLVVGESNARAVGLGKRVADNAPIPAGVIVIYGQPGTGKTHLLKSIEHRAAMRADGRRMTYISAEEFMTRFVEGSRAGDTAALQAFVKENDLLMIDDLHWIAGKDKTDKAFFGALRKVTSQGGHVLITADAAPGDMVGLSKRLTSELRGAAAVEVAMPDNDMRKQIVRRHADLIAHSTPSFIVTDEMIDRIVASIRGAGRELCGVLWSLQLETGYGEMAPTMTMLETVIRRIAGEPRTPSLDDIKRACMELYSVSKTDIESASKVRTICHPRQIAMYLSRTMTDKSYPQIAHAYKKKDHTTVLHAYRKINRALKKGDPDMISDIEHARNAVFDRLANLDG